MRLRQSIGLGLGLGLGTGGGSAPYVPPAWPAFPSTRLADLSRIAKINGGGSIAVLSDVTTEGMNAVRATNFPTSDTLLAPLAADLPAAINMSAGGVIALRWKPVTNVGQTGTNVLSGGRFVFEIFSGTTVTTGNYHESSRFSTGSTAFLQPTAPDASNPGRVQTTAIAVKEFTAFGTGADLTAIRGARLRLRGSSATGVIELIDITYYPPVVSKPACIFYFDDIYASHLSYVAPKLAEYGWSAVSAPGSIQSYLGQAGRLTLAQVKQLQNTYGWQIATQAWSTEDSSLLPDYATLDAEFEAAKAFYAAEGLNGGESGSYFSNVGFQEVARTAAFRDNFRDTRLFLLGNATTPIYTHAETWPTDRHLLRCYSGATAAWGANAYTYIKSAIDRTIANGGAGVLRLGWHEEPGTPGNAQTAFESTLAYLDAKRAEIDVITHDELLRRTNAAIGA